MIEDKLKKVSAIMLTALLFVAAFLIIPQDNLTAAAGQETNTITIPIRDVNGPLSIANVVLTEVHTGNQLYPIFENDYFVVDNAPSGHYRIDVSADGYYDEVDVDGFEFKGTQQFTLNPEIYMTKFGDFIYTASVNVKNGLGSPVKDATVMFYDRTQMQDLSSNITDSNGDSDIVISGGTFDIVVTAAGYEMYVESLSISGDFNKNITLNNSAALSGFAFKASGGIAGNVVAYLYNINTSQPIEKRILKSAASSFVGFDAYPDDWILVVDAPDLDPVIQWYNISALGQYSLVLSLEEQSSSTEDLTIELLDWNNIVVSQNSTLMADMAYPGLDYADIGSLRAQVDLALGNADGSIDAGEFTTFYNYINSIHGPNFVTTSNLFKVNDTQYIRSSIDLVFMTDLTGPVVSSDNITYQSEASYTSQTGLDAASDLYVANITVQYDSDEVSRTYTIDLVSDYELTWNYTFTSKVDVNGYMTVIVDPLISATPGSEIVALEFQKSEGPISKAAIQEEENTYKKLDNTTLLYYIARNNTTVSFNSYTSKDPNGNPITFTWDFDDGSPLNVTTGWTVEHNYTVAGNLTVSMNVTDVSGLYNVTTFNLKIDSQAPRAAIDVLNRSESPVIAQGDTLEFSPSGSADDLYSVGDGAGHIDSYEWTFGNESVELVNNESAVSHTFNDAGSIEVVLNITDVVGNYANASITITVNDTTAPSINLATPLRNETGGTTLLEKRPIFFDAKNTTDNTDELDDLNFTWNFGDDSDIVTGMGSAFAYVNHTYDSFGQYTNFTLKVTDLSGNNDTHAQTIQVGTGPRPRINPVRIGFSPDTFEEGKVGTITVNITNEGSAVAKNMSVEVWHYLFDDAKELLGTITTFYSVNSTPISQLGVGESGYGMLEWTPSSKGNYTIRAIADSDDQPIKEWKSSYTVVNEAGWKKIALYAGVLAILIIVPLLLFARRRIASGKGFKRSSK